MEPQIRYAQSVDGTSIAYSTLGHGRPLVIVGGPTALIGIRSEWRIPRMRRVLEQLAESMLVVWTDPRGRGLSAHDVDDQSLEANVADLHCVVERVSSTPVDLVGDWSAPIGMAYAARHPERVRTLSVVGSPYPRGADHRIAPVRWELGRLAQVDFEFYKQAMALLNYGWTEGRIAAEEMRDLQWEEQQAGWSAIRGFDASDDVPNIRCPVLVLHLRALEDETPVSASRQLVTALPNAELRIIEDTVGYTIFDEGGRIFQAIREFLNAQDGRTSLPATPSGTAIIMFADIADSTALTERMGDAAFRARARELDEALRAAVRDRGGAVIDAKTLGDGILATFPAAAQAVAAALACGGAGSHAGLPLHLGLHAGDVIREADNVFGGAVNIAARVSALSAPGEVLVSDIVRGLARTSAGVTFEDRGEQALKGVGEPIRIFAVTRGGG